MKVFQEKLYEHHSQTFSIDAELYRGQTEFQEVLIFKNRLFGRVLVLDGIVQLTQRDNPIYHETCRSWRMPGSRACLLSVEATAASSKRY